MSIKLTVLRDSDERPVEERQFECEQPVTIGRIKDMDVVLGSRKVSRRHLVIENTTEGYTVTDVSKFGTSMNGEVLPPQQPTVLSTRDRSTLVVGPFTLIIEVLDDELDERTLPPRTRQRDEDATCPPRDDPPRPATGKRTKAERSRPLEEPAVADDSDEVDSAGEEPSAAESDAAVAVEMPTHRLRVESPAPAPVAAPAPAPVAAPAPPPPREDVFDPEAEAAELVGELRRMWALHRHADPAVRTGSLRPLIGKRIGRAGTGNAGDLLRSAMRQLRGVQPEEPPVVEAAEPEPEPEQPEVSTGAARDAWCEIARRFVGGAELEAPEDFNRLGELVGQTIDSFLDWLYKSLRVRGEIQEQFDAEVSMMFRLKENPIKRAGSPEKIGHFLLDWESGARPESIRKHLEAVLRDLTLHQLGVMEGVNECTRELLREFDPAKIRQKVEGDGALRGILARLTSWVPVWREYERTFSLLSERKLFNQKIYPHFKQAYQDSHEELESEMPQTIVGKKPPRRS